MTPRRGSLIASVVAVATVAVVVALALSGCARGGEPQVAQPPASTETATPSAPATGSTDASGVPLAQLTISLDKVVDGLDAPLYATNAGDGSGRLFVVEQSGQIRVLRDGKLSAQPFVDLQGQISTGGERGLLGLAFAPDYETSGRFYVNYTDSAGNTVVARYVASPPSSDTPKLTGPERLLYIEQPYSNHNGGCIQFGPDGMLYVGMGDGGSSGDPQNRAQNPASPLGKMLRIDVSGKTYSVPPDNPFAKQPYPRNITWASGLRNPWRYSFDTPSGELWIGDVGQGEWEEIDLVQANRPALNYGWNRWEGNHPYPPGAKRSRKGFTFPVVEYAHPTGESVTGGYVYRGAENPALAGTYLYADFVKGWIAGVRVDRSVKGVGLRPLETRRLLDTGLAISSFGVDEQNELYVVDLGGGLYKVRATAK